METQTQTWTTLFTDEESLEQFYVLEMWIIIIIMVIVLFISITKK
jgi:hypothetical protein